MFHSRSYPGYILAAFLALGLAAVAPACGGDKESGNTGGSGGEGGTGGTDILPGVEICDNNADEDDDGLIDCQDPDCEESPLCCVGEACFAGCTAEGQAKCEREIDQTVSMVCTPEGVCEPAGLLDADGNLRRGEAMVMSKTAEVSTMNYRGQQVLVLSSKRPNTTEPLDCNKIMSREVDPTDPTQVNAVYEMAAQIAQPGDLIPAPAFGVPLPREDEDLILVVRFFAATPDEKTNPRGDIVGEGCTVFDTIPEGRYDTDSENPDRQWQVTIRLYCGGALNRQCPEPKSCQYGLCRDNRCAEQGTPCSAGYVCREWEGEVACRKSCNPESPVCPNLHRCDATPGEVAVCVEAD
jgi:hypothetical protein